ncbi:MAG: IS3 family transposase ISAzvi9 [Legionellaceae bacterium]
MKYAFIREHSKQFSIALMCELFSISRSAYCTRSPSQQEQANRQLDRQITVIYNQHKKRYGSPRITRELLAQNEKCSHTRVARRMKEMGLVAVAKKKFKVTTDSEHNLPIYKNILSCDFSTTGMNQKWACDITYVHTKEGWLYLAVVIDLYSRAIIGWSMSNRMKKTLVCDALMMALFKRKFPKNVIVHSDRGSQYCSGKYQNIIKDYRLVGSMSRKANCWDNAIAESFFHTLKVELIHESVYKTRKQARLSIFQYVEGYYNNRRKHSSINYMTRYEAELAG